MTTSSLDTINDHADFMHSVIGVNVIPADTRRKATYESWSQWQDQPIPDEIHEEHKTNGHYDNGIAIITGKIWRGQYKDKYLVAIDLDNRKAIEEFCRDKLDYFKERTLVEQHANPDKMHIYFIVDKQIPDKSSDIHNVSVQGKIDSNEIPAIEVKSSSKKIMFCSNSPHKNGSNYQFISTLNPITFEAWGIQEQISIICDKYNIQYANNSSNGNGNSNSSSSTTDPYLIPIQHLFTPGTKILEGHNRHLGILRVMDSLLLKNMGFLKLEEIKEHSEKRNQELCVPPLSSIEIDKQWNSALKFAERKRKEREKQQKAKQPDSTNNNADDTTATKTTTGALDKQQLIEQGTELVMSEHTFLTIEESKEILYYDDERGVYSNGGEIIIERDLEEIFNFEIKSADIAEIKGHIMRKTYVKREAFDADLDIINLKNGLYNIRTGELNPHSPDYYSINQKPFSYNPEAKSEHFETFLSQVLYPEDIETAIDIIAYTFVRYNPHEIYFILIGVGSNGKSVYTGLITNLHGTNNISNVPLKALANDHFALADLDGKDVNIDTEMSSNSIKDLSVLKKLTGIQPIRVQHKHQRAYDTVLHAKLIFNANQLPVSEDNTDAHYRREIILSFPNQFEGTNEDPDLLKKLTSETELSGIFNLVKPALKRLVETQRVKINQNTIAERKRKAQLIREPIKAFLKDAISSDSQLSDYELVDDLYDAYIRFCKYHKLPIQSKPNFNDEVERNPATQAVKDRKEIPGERKKKQVWKHIKLRRWRKIDKNETLTPEDAEEDDLDIPEDN